MAKRSQRHALRYERDRAGCIWGFISIFDFRHGRTTRKLLSDRKRGSKPTFAGSSSMLNIPNPSDNSLTIKVDEESEAAVMPDSKTSVKELMEEDMVNEQNLKNQGNGSEIINAEDLNSPSARWARKNSRRTRRAGAGYFRSEDQDSAGIGLGDLDIVMEELRQIHQRSSNFVKVRHIDDQKKQSDQTLLVVEEKVNAAIEVFINQRSRNSKRLDEDDKTNQSKEYMDALHTLSSNKEFILKLLQDPNSKLVKQIGNSEDAWFEKVKHKPDLVSEETRGRAKTDDVMNNHKQRKFFRRRSKSQDSFPSMENETPRTSSKIVILKPGPASPNVSPPVHSQYAEKRALQNERNTSQFSFTEIKRRLKHAMGKDRPPEETIQKFPSALKRSNSDRGISGDNVGWSSPNRNHFYTEKFAKSPLSIKKGDKTVKSRGVEVTDSSDFPRLGMSNIYIEAKKHLVEMLDNEDETTEASSGHLSKSLGRILSFPEYNSSPVCSPRSNNKDSMVTPQMTEPLSPLCRDLEIESSGSVIKIEVPCENGNTLAENSSSTDHTSPEGDLTEETMKTRSQEEGEVISSLSELGSAPVERDIPIDCAANAVDDPSSSQGFESSFDSLKEHPSGKDQTLSSPPASPARSSSPKKVEDFDIVVDKIGRPSPVSVLEPLFTEDDVSPASTICHPVDPEIEPRKIQFEEPVSSINEEECPIACFENEESAFEYVEAVLLGSGLNWDEFLLRWLSSDQILDPSLFDEVELFSSRPCHDQKLLFDSTNEVLKAVCDLYYHGVSLGRHTIRPVPKGMDLINEIWEGVEWYILEYSTPHSLDQLVKMDMERSRTWMDLRPDLGHIGVEMGDIILEELVEDMISSIPNDTLECEEYVIFPAKSEEIESSMDK